MTVLSAYQNAMVMLTGVKPDTLFSSTEAPEIKMQTIVNMAAKQILQDFDWQQLKRLCTITGTGAEDYALPADYDRMLVDGEVHSDTWTTFRYEKVASLDEWLDLLVLRPALPPGYWIIYNNRFHVLPTMGAGTVARFFYISNSIVQPISGSATTEFSADGDRFVLDEHLLTLAIIWRWKAAEGLEYSEDMQNYEIYRSILENKNDGSSVIRSRRARPANRGFPFYP